MDSNIKNSISYSTHSEEWDLGVSNSIAHKYLEKPAMKSLIPDLEFKDILCIGIGSGEELSEIIKYNPKRIVGIDISEELLNIAKNRYPSIEIHKMDMMHLSFPDNSFDFIYSSLAFHYSNDWDILLRGIHRILKPNGILLFSTHNPEYWAQKEKTNNVYTNERGVTLTEHKAFVQGNTEILFYNHPNTESIIKSLEFNNFRILESLHPKVIKPFIRLKKSDQDRYDSLAKNNSKVPIFLVVMAQKRIE